MSGQRCFVAVLPPDDAVEDLDAFLEPRREHAGFRWTPPEHLHLTLAFLASVPDRALDDLVEAVGAAAARRTPFDAALSGGGAFPDAASARVLYAGLRLDEVARDQLERLALGVRTAAGVAGVDVDGQRFRPHVTVARMGRRTEATRWVRLLDAYAGPVFGVDRVVLVASHLGEGPRRRPRHEVLAELPLGPRVSGARPPSPPSWPSWSPGPAAPPRSR